MLPRKDLVVSFILLWIFLNNAKCQDIEKMSKTLDDMLIGVRSFRRPRDYENASLIWEEYEYDTGAGNREEVVVTNITMHTYSEIPEGIGWRFLKTEKPYLIHAEDSTLFLDRINLDELSIKHIINITSDEHIVLFKVFELSAEETENDRRSYDLMAVLLIKSQNGYFIYWYRIFENAYTLFSISPVQKEIHDMEIARERDQYRLFLLSNDDAHLEEESLIDVYFFNIDYTRYRVDVWFCRRLYIPKTFDIEICSIYEGTVLALQGIDSIVLYKSRDDDAPCQFEETQIIKTCGFTNFVCFESGYIEYLAIADEQARLFHYFEREFQDNAETDLHFNGIAEIAWITAIPLNTYRDESLLLVQLKNSTVIVLTWQGSRFVQVPLPNRIMDAFDLSKVVAIPKFGFVQGNTFVHIEVTLRDLAHPIYRKTQSMLKTQALLEEVFRKQETIFDETEMRLNRSYFENPVVTGFWNLSTVEVSNATLEKDVNYRTIRIGAINLTIEDMWTNTTSTSMRLEQLETKLDEILSNLTDMFNANTTKIFLSSDIEITGNFLVNGTLYAKNVTATFMNNTSTTAAANDAVDDIANIAIKGQKSFPSMEADNLTIFFLNGVPLEDILFDVSIKDYSNVDFSKLKRLEIDGHLNFSEINDVNWEDLMRSVVWKNKPAIIPGETIVEGELIAEEEPYVSNLNQLRYPEDYVLIDDKSPINVTGEKSFVSLSTSHLFGIKTINGIDIDDFIILNRNEVIDQEITFENLHIENSLTIDGDITGINSIIEPSLNETNKLLSNVIFENLTVIGNIVLENSVNAKTWSDFDDLLLKTESSAVITGNKTFLRGVNVQSNMQIKSERINGHPISEFVTLDTDQTFPHLEKISANVTFGNVTFGAVKKLEDYIIREQNNSSGCLNKMLLFTKSPLIDDLSFDTLKQTISRAAFLDKLNKTFQQVYFENLTLSTLTADEVLPNTVNGIDYIDLVKRALTVSTRQNLTGSLTIDNLETDILNVESINRMSLTELNRLLKHSKSLYDDIFNGDVSLDSLRVEGIINTSFINEKDSYEIYEEDRIATVIFHKNVSIENLSVIGFVNGLNLSEIVSDAVSKHDRNVTFTGHKTFENVTCEFLKTRFVNGHSVDDILDPDKEQTLKGPVVVNGSVTVLRDFNTSGKIGDVYFDNFTDRFKPLGNYSYALRGDFRFNNENVSVTNLDVNGPIQTITFDSFLETAIFKNNTNITITGSKSFEGLIVFNDTFVIDGTLNDLDLHTFYEKAIYIDKPFSIESDVIFRENVHIQKNLVVKTKLEANTIMGVNMKELKDSVIALDKPTYFPARMTLDNATFEAGIKVAQINDLQMDLLIPLHTEQTIMINKLNCTNIIYKNIEISGRVNNYDLNAIYADTFMLHGNQHITGHIKFRGNVYAYHDFNAHLINGFSPKEIVSLVTDDTITGNFLFKNPIIFKKNLKVLGSLNGITPVNWQGMTMITDVPTKHIVSGKWRVHGNVYFEGNIEGNEYLNGLNVTEMLSALTEEHAEINSVIKEINENFDNMCADLNELKCKAVNQIYKFNTFDHLKILEFDGDINDVHYVELNDLDYLFVSHDTCRMKLLLHSQGRFVMIEEVPDFGLVDHWISFKLNNTLWLFTIPKHICGKNFINMWKLENNRLTHIAELDNTTNVEELYQSIFIAMVHEEFDVDSEDLRSEMLGALTYEDKRLILSSFDDQILMANPRRSVYEFERTSSHITSSRNCSDCYYILNFKVGIYQRKQYIYYDQEVSRDYIYLCKDDVTRTEILQTIKAHQPKSFVILNFDDFIETLLIFVENGETIQIYEYRGIEGFVYKNAIKMKVDKLYGFKIRKHISLKRRYCLAAIYGNRLTILEAKMHGEKLDLSTLAEGSCNMSSCSIY